MSDPTLRAESHAVLRVEAKGKFGRLPLDLVADAVLRVTEGGDHHLERAALDALARRFAAAKEAEGWKVVHRPAKGRKAGD